MSYKVLARKWRPKNFEAMLGQTHVLQALINALNNQRLHHAYLFSGSRGVGKTTIARILAKCLNCQQGVSAKPCGECSACQEIDQGRFIDLIEVDAASRTRVEDTRELLDNVQYAPSCGRYKVYLIDEVHMLSGHSFNALLKTLEEPPEHVKFLLATTEPQKLPPTVLSRCLQFFLKNLSVTQIADHLAMVLEQEKIAFESPALLALAEAADGSVRDSLSLLDQAIAFSDGNLSLTAVQEMLGAVDRRLVFSLLTAIATNDTARVFAEVTAVAEQGVDFANLLEQVLSVLHRVALAHALPDAIDDTMGDQADIVKLCEQISVEDTQLFYQIALHGRRDLPLAPSAKGGFEMSLLRMLAFRPMAVSVPTKEIQPEKPAAVAVNEHKLNWSAIVASLQLTGLTAALAAHTTMRAFDDGEIQLQLAANQLPLLNPTQQERLQQALQIHFGKPLKLTINIGEQAEASPAAIEQHQQSAEQQKMLQSIQDDPKVKEIVEKFDGIIDVDSIRSR